MGIYYGNDSGNLTAAFSAGINHGNCSWVCKENQYRLLFHRSCLLLALLGMAVELQIKSGDTMRLLKASDVAKGFSSSMFVTLVGVTFLFGMASQNGTLDLFSKKIVALVGKRTYLIPVLMFFCPPLSLQLVRATLQQVF